MFSSMSPYCLHLNLPPTGVKTPPPPTTFPDQFLFVPEKNCETTFITYKSVFTTDSQLNLEINQQVINFFIQMSFVLN
jgi:hypothetical protein